MGHEDLLEDTHWVLRTRHRRLRIGDLMIAVAMIALALAVVSLADLASGQRLLLATIALASLGLQWAQWGLAGIRTTQSRSGAGMLLGVLSSLIALAMLVFLVFLGLVFPQGAALLSVMMLLLVVYQTTWD